jgi:hypothetical protein
MKQFVGIYQLSRHLDDYIEVFLAVRRFDHPFALTQLTNTRASAEFQGGGVQAPPLSRVLGMGQCFVLRELFRHQVLANPHAHPHCFVPVGRVRRMLLDLGCDAVAANLIIDESSMVDLARLVVVCRALEVHEPDVRRVVFVGDENQLPPIGMGRPLQDILDFLHRDPEAADRHVVRLRSNCRQRQDRTVVDAAQLFAGKNRYRTDLYQKLLQGGEISPHLRVVYWSTPEELYKATSARLDKILNLTESSTPEECEKALNLHFNLYDNGYVKGYREKEENQLRVDNLQLLSPYRGGYSGAMGLNQSIRDRYRAISYPKSATNSGGRRDSAFAHSDKVIRISNFYGWRTDEDDNWGKELLLSNGSIGVLNNNPKRDGVRTFPIRRGNSNGRPGRKRNLNPPMQFRFTRRKAANSMKSLW